MRRFAFHLEVHREDALNFEDEVSGQIQMHFGVQRRGDFEQSTAHKIDVLRVNRQSQSEPCTERVRRGVVAHSVEISNDLRRHIGPESVAQSVARRIRVAFAAKCVVNVKNEFPALSIALRVVSVLQHRVEAVQREESVCEVVEQQNENESISVIVEERERAERCAQSTLRCTQCTARADSANESWSEHQMNREQIIL